MKIIIEILDECYGGSFDEDDNLFIQEPPVGDRVKREKLLDRSIDKSECFRSEKPGVVVDSLLELTPGYRPPEMNKAEKRHQNICRQHLNKFVEI